MQDEFMEHFLVGASVVQLQVDEYFVPDLQPPEDYQGPHLIATAHAGRLATLSRAGKRYCDLPFETASALLEEAAKARNEKIDTGADTATGRVLTVLTLRVEHARGSSQSFTCRAIINHYVPRALPPHWSALLRIFRDAAGLVDAVHAEVWEWALTWSGPIDLGPLWQVGAAVRLPHRVASIEHDGTLYVRTGQPPEPSSLYRLERGTLTCLDDDRVIEPRGRSFILPCGGGSITPRREWKNPHRIVIRADDSRGIYVQRG